MSCTNLVPFLEGAPRVGCLREEALRREHLRSQCGAVRHRVCGATVLNPPAHACSQLSAGYVFVSRWSCTVTCSSRERERSARAICSSGLQLNLSATGVTCWLLARARAQRGARAGCSRERERERDAFAAYGSIHRVSARSSQLRAHAKSALARVFSCITARA